MTTVEHHDIDIAEIIGARHRDTPLWNRLLAEYDAATLDDVGSGWDRLANLSVDVPAEEPGQDQPAEQPEQAPEQEPVEEPEQAPAPVEEPAEAREQEPDDADQ